MVKHWVNVQNAIKTGVTSVLVICLLLSTSVFAAESPQLHNTVAKPVVQVQVKIRPNRVQLGSPITVVIEGENVASSFSKIDWSVFSQNFIIEDIDQGSNMLRARLYPIRVGQYKVAAQRAGIIAFPETTITVKDNPDVDVHWQSLKSHAFSQQQILWRAQVTVSNPAFLVEQEVQEDAKNADIQIKQSLISTIQSSQQSKQKEGITHQAIASYEMPSIFAKQSIQIKSPVVVVKNTSNRRWKFFDASQTVTVQPLPGFLPMSVAVGQLGWQAQARPSVGQAGLLHYWQWELVGHGMNGVYLKSTAYQLIEQLAKAKNVTWLTESMTLTEGMDEQGVLSKLSVQIPYRITQPGLVSFPLLTLRAFDPNTGKVSQQVLAESFALGLPSWLIWTLQWLALGLVILVVFVSLFIVKQAWFNRLFFKAIDDAQDSQSIWLAMQVWRSNHMLDDEDRAQLSLKNQQNSQTINSVSVGQWKNWYAKEYSLTAEQIKLTQKLLEWLDESQFSRKILTPNTTEDERLQQVIKPWLAKQSLWPSFSQLKRYLQQLRKQVTFK